MVSQLSNIKIVFNRLFAIYRERKLKHELLLNKLRAQAHCSGTDETWTVFRAVYNRIKVVIGKAKRAFLNTALSSKRPKEVWWVVHRDIHPSPRPFLADPDQLNCYFIKTID